jgi:hypothetical protein
MKVISDFLPVALTVVGWGVAGWLAVKQINIAHEKNRKLQQEQNIKTVRSEVYKQFLPIYMDIGMTINHFNHSMNHTHMNMSLDDKLGNDSVTFGWKQSMPEIDMAYSEYCEKMSLLEVWLSAVESHISNSADVEKAIRMHKAAFTTDGGIRVPWLELQGIMIGMKKSGASNAGEFHTTMKSIQEQLNEIREQLQSCAKAIQRDLISYEI